MEVRDLVALAVKRRTVIALCFLLTVGFGAVFAFSQAKRYESVVTIALTPDVQNQQGFIATDTLDGLLSTYAQTAASRVNLNRAQQLIGRPLPGTVRTESQQGAGILRIWGNDTSPSGAALTARAVADAFIQSIRGNKLLVASIVDPATVPTSPVQPRPPLIIGVSAVLGLMAGLMLAVAIEHFRRRVDTHADVAEFTTAPVIGRLPRTRILQRGAPTLVWNSPNLAGLQEAFRALRTNIEFVTKGRSSFAIQVTSPNTGQGKSTIVANLGVAFAQVGVETLILDADLRRPFQHRIFGLANDRGLSTLMAIPDADVQPIPSGVKGLWVMPSGPAPPNSTEMLHIRFERVLRGLVERYDLVLIDTPPLLPVSDARLVAPQTDGVVLAISAGSQRPASLRSALEKLDLAGANLIGVVLNQAGEDVDTAEGYDAYRYELVRQADEVPDSPPVSSK